MLAAVRVKSEDEVYDAVARWLQHEPAARKGAPDVLYRVMREAVRLPLVSARCFADRVMPDLMHPNAGADCAKRRKPVPSVHGAVSGDRAIR